MSCLLIKRGAQTPLALPNGEVCYPHEEMPALRVQVEELGYAEKTTAVTVAAVVTKLLRSLYTIRNENDTTPIILNDPDTDSEAHNGAINMTVLRTLWMISMDYKAYRLMQMEDRTSMTREEELIRSISQATKLGSITEREELKKAISGSDTPNLVH